MSESRRKFIKKTVQQSALIALGVTGLQSLAESASNLPSYEPVKTTDTGFDQTPLPYAFNALEDMIDTMTMEIHYSKHAAAYAKNAKEAALAEKFDINQPIENLLNQISNYSVKLRNNAGGHYNHELFWRCMRPKSDNNLPKGELLESIDYAFGSFDSFKLAFSEAAKTRFGSGWTWLYKTKDGELKIGSTPNQDNPLMNLSGTEVKGTPLLCLDVWEHAYYLKYQNKRADYIQNWWSLVNWDYVQKRFDEK